MNQEKLVKIDKGNMRDVIRDFPRQLKEETITAQKVTLNKKGVDLLVIAGMGGSALAGEILQLIQGQKNIFKKSLPIIIHKNYGLPPMSGAKAPLVVCISHSGNTEETIQAYKNARARKFAVIVITSGGTLASLAKKNKTPRILLPKKNIQPRSATGYHLLALLHALTNVGIINSQEKELLALAKVLRPELLESRGRIIARALRGTTPIFYTSETNKALGYIFKIKVNENAKTMAFTNFFPELNHNEIAGFTRLAGWQDHPQNKFSVVVLQDSSDYPKIKQRMKLLGSLEKKYHLPVYMIDISNERIYNKIFDTLLLGDWISYYLALFNKVDPTPVLIVEEFKKKTRR